MEGELDEFCAQCKWNLRASPDRALYSNRGWREKNFENVVFEPVWRGKLFQMKVFGAAIDSVKFSSKSELSSRFFGRLKFSESNFCETLNGRLILEDGSDRRKTLPKRVSDDSRHLIF